MALARDLVARNEQVVLVDLARGASVVSGRLGMPRVPGFTDLAAGRASFSDVIRIDDETPLQVITAGNPAVPGDGREPDRFMQCSRHDASLWLRRAPCRYCNRASAVARAEIRVAGSGRRSSRRGEPR
ncbi:MAG: hypothetical protein R3D30_02380 [Hyphomicrobiales bacterium]